MTKALTELLGNDAESNSTLGLITSVLIKYGAAPIVCILFAYWLQVKDAQVNDLHRANVELLRQSTIAIERNTAAFESLKEQLRRPMK